MASVKLLISVLAETWLPAACGRCSGPAIFRSNEVRAKSVILLMTRYLHGDTFLKGNTTRSWRTETAWKAPGSIV